MYEHFLITLLWSTTLTVIPIPIFSIEFENKSDNESIDSLSVTVFWKVIFYVCGTILSQAPIM